MKWAPGQNRCPGPCQRGRFEGVRFAPRRRRPAAAAEELLAANALDVQAGREAGMSRALLDRLSLTEARIQDMAAAVEEVAKSADPVGKTLSGQRLPNGLQLEKVTVPLGVIGIIYEARPNVTSDGRRPVPEGGERRHPPGREGGLPLQPGGGQGAAGGLGGRGPACRLRPAGGGHLPPVRPRADGPDGVPGRAHPPGRGGAHPLGEGERPGCL